MSKGKNNAECPFAVLQEFVEDVKLAYGTGRSDAIDEEAMDWPDLAVTYRKAVFLLRSRRKEKRV